MSEHISRSAAISPRRLKRELKILHNNRPLSDRVQAGFNILELYTRKASFFEARHLLAQGKLYRETGGKHPLVQVADALWKDALAPLHPQKNVMDGRILTSQFKRPPALQVIQSDLVLMVMLCYSLVGEYRAALKMMKHHMAGVSLDLFNCLSHRDGNPEFVESFAQALFRSSDWQNAFSIYDSTYYCRPYEEICGDGRMELTECARRVGGPITLDEPGQVAMTIASVAVPMFSYRWFCGLNFNEPDSPSDLAKWMNALFCTYTEAEQTLFEFDYDREPPTPAAVQYFFEACCYKIIPRPQGASLSYGKKAKFSAEYDCRFPQRGMLHLLIQAARLCLEHHLHRQQLRDEFLLTCIDLKDYKPPLNWKAAYYLAYREYCKEQYIDHGGDPAIFDADNPLPRKYREETGKVDYKLFLS